MLGLIVFLAILIIFIIAVNLPTPEQKPFPSPKPVNVINGVTYPLPDDPRWKANPGCHGWGTLEFDLGETNLKVYHGPLSEWGTVDFDRVTVANGDAAYQYGDAIYKAYQARQVQNALKEACNQGIVVLQESA